jgi:predicted transglutaminase-like cysteine proteinase
MQRVSWISALLAVGFSAGELFAQSSQKASDEIWYAAFIAGKKNGYSRYTVEPVNSDEGTISRATQQMRLYLNRGGTRVELKQDMGTDELPNGKVVGVFMKQWIGQEQALTMIGKLVGNKMSVTVEGPQPNARLHAWNNSIIGLESERKLLRIKQIKPGDKLDYQQFYPSINAVLRTKVTVGQVSEVVLPNQTKPMKLLEVTLKPDRVQDVQLPSSTYWVDPTTLEAVMVQSELPGLGEMKLVRTTKQAALAEGSAAAPDTMAQSIKLAKPIDNIHAATAITYRINLAKADSDVKKLIAEDDRQSIDDAVDKAFSLRVESVRQPISGKAGNVPEEYLKSNYFINSDDLLVKKHAAEATGSEKDPWRQAQSIERWVRLSMKPVDYRESMATADHVAKTMSGDCTEFAMLTAAMCRAKGIPSKTAIGLVYVNDRTMGPILAFHMWTEVFVQGQWLALDATLGQGSIGPGHLKITDHHWSEIRGFDPLLPVMGFLLAKPTVDITSVRRPR